MMWKNYLKIGLRNLYRHKAFSTINIMGLATGMACCAFILLYVQYELSFDTYHKNNPNIYRLVLDLVEHGVDNSWARVSNATGPAIERDLPEIKRSARIFSKNRFDPDNLVTYGEKRIEEEGVMYFSDPGYFQIFTHEFLAGEPVSALENPNSLVLTEEIATKVFGTENPLQKTISIGNREYAVTGVIENIPANSHFRFDYLLSVNTLQPPDSDILDDFDVSSGFTYLLIEDEVDIAALQSKINELVFNYPDHPEMSANAEATIVMQKLTDIHLGSTGYQLDYTNNVNTDKSNVTIFSVIALVVLFMACINFMNLSTAKSANRAKEVGLRKVFGSFKKQLITQFLSESLFLSAVSSIIAVVLIVMLLPAFGNLTGREITFQHLLNNVLITGFAGLVLLTGLIAGLYPAFFLSAFRPIMILKGKMSTGSKNIWLRKSLIVVQFSITATLISSTLIILNQLQFMKSRNLGYDKEHIVVIPVQQSISQNYEAVKNELLRNPNVLSATLTRYVPGQNTGRSGFIPEGGSINDDVNVNLHPVDFHFVQTFGMEIVEGRDFSSEIITDRDDAFIINETAAKSFGWWYGNAVGKRISTTFPSDRDGTVIGVVKDFHQKSLRENIDPTVLAYWPQYGRILCVKIQSQNISGTLQFLENKMQEFDPGRAFNYYFLDEAFDRQYHSEEKLSTLFMYFVALSILIACLGLYGLVSFTTEQKAKEIGIRKVLGASTKSVVLQLSQDFWKLVVISNIISVPIGYYLMVNWVQGFAYQTSINIEVFIFSGMLSIFITFGAVGYQSVKSALANPVQSLRYE